MTRGKRRKTTIGGQFIGRLVEMLESPVMRVLNQSEHRVLMRLEIELAHHGGTSNGALVVTHQQFVDFGVDREAVAPSIRCLAALKLIEITKQGRGGNREYREASQYRLTYLHTDRADPTHDWRSITTKEQAKNVAVEARRAKGVEAVERSKKARQKQETGSESPQVSGRKVRPETEQIQVGNSDVVARVGNSDVASISRGGSTKQPPREARPPHGAVASGAAAPSNAPMKGDEVLLDEIAKRLGLPDGWLIVQDLHERDPDHLRNLVVLQSRGALGEQVLVGLRFDHLKRKAA
ncbi:hypothetical protein [Bradyrhizobium australafricanum]|uniref:hypothetical protein n=1 Tax=Bradyrhizobium australafricanum TaxID=2821406 RepID=UPI001CE260D4|nr:hypothetical protein [Bradyrhizobium australafricanum]MCA6103941.1 hypothetical protein [Bradyrhizobium australafricanum]